MRAPGGVRGAERWEGWGDVGCCDGDGGGWREGGQVGEVGCFVAFEGGDFVGN
jgi:hypothetical protein